MRSAAPSFPPGRPPRCATCWRSAPASRPSSVPTRPPSSARTRRSAPEDAGYYSVAPLRATLERPGRSRSAQQRRSPAHGRRVQRPDQRDALFRQPRHAARPRSCHGLGRAAAGLPGGADRRRALLGRRHPFEHAGRGRVRRQSAPQFDGLRGPYLEPAGRGAGDDLGGDEPPEGRPIFEPRPFATSSASASSTGCAMSSPSWPGWSRTSASATTWSPSWPAMAA